jgi:hypothetical protein
MLTHRAEQGPASLPTSVQAGPSPGLEQSPRQLPRTTSERRRHGFPASHHEPHDAAAASNEQPAESAARSCVAAILARPNLYRGGQVSRPPASNLVMSARPRAAVRFRGEQVDAVLCQSHHAGAFPRYPRILGARAAERRGERPDQYALACVAFELLTAQQPFRGEHPWAVLNAHMNQPPRSAAALRPELPPAVDAVLRRALAKQSTERFGSCGEFAGALRKALSLPPYGASDGGYQLTQVAVPVAGPAPAAAPVAAEPTNSLVLPVPPGPWPAWGRRVPPRLATLAGVAAVLVVAILLAAHVIFGLGYGAAGGATGTGTRGTHPPGTRGSATGTPGTGPLLQECPLRHLGARNLTPPRQLPWSAGE